LSTTRLGLSVLYRSVLVLAFATASAADEPIDVERYLEIVLRSHPAARQAGGLEEVARAERKAARLIPDPVVEISRDRGRLSEAPGTRAAETGISVTQTIPWPGTFAAGIRAGDRAAETLRASGQAVRWEIEIEARRAFTRLVSARSLVDIARAAEEDARSLRDLVARRAELGESRESERIKTTVEWLRQQRNLATAEREAAAIEALVRTLAVEPLPRPLKITGELPPPVPPPDPESLKNRLLERNPGLRAAGAEAERQKALLSVSRRGRIPDLEVTVFRNQELDKEANGFSIGLKVPLWNANRGEIARAQAGASLAAAAAERARLDLLTELESRLKDLEVAASQGAILDSEILPAAAKSLGLARFSYQEGETSLLELLDAQRTYRETQREAVEARLAQALALAELQRLVGPDFNPWR
jgi:cobalt-zinc-cadmium efflux system outer membrane protein